MLSIVLIPLLFLALAFIYVSYRMMRWWLRREGDDLAEW